MRWSFWVIVAFVRKIHSWTFLICLELIFDWGSSQFLKGSKSEEGDMAFNQKNLFLQLYSFSPLSLISGLISHSLSLSPAFSHHLSACLSSISCLIFYLHCGKKILNSILKLDWSADSRISQFLATSTSSLVFRDKSFSTEFLFLFQLFSFIKRFFAESHFFGLKLETVDQHHDWDDAFENKVIRGADLIKCSLCRMSWRAKVLT